ncbi:hypothetical protein FHR81_004189 [Actinoalloteichus hoggarensis]|uniref:Uncharacterized protein n=1 Tax=Actinoalloteichus hoggarensis TaxID=1470176 RepID=A0A221W9Q5_9PSEU|nr:hypothetical protein [Actinoalloteichus hoggarensis]ASO22454.1 hypothetical protein AHOG_24240 [Actinoalloteichus hoggarensis]MBB5923122.1 hypothetical protein [Actinoalloteichus hoggarensis]
MGGAGEVRGELLDIADRLPAERLTRQREKASEIAGELDEAWRGSEYAEAAPAVAGLREVTSDLTAAAGLLRQGSELLRAHAARL